MINTLIEKAYTGGEDGKGYLDDIQDPSRFKDFYEKAKLVLVSDFEFIEADKQKVKDALEKLNEISPNAILIPDRGGIDNVVNEIISNGSYKIVILILIINHKYHFFIYFVFFYL